MFSPGEMYFNTRHGNGLAKVRHDGSLIEYKYQKPLWC